MDRLNLNRQPDGSRQSLNGNVLRNPILRGFVTTLLALLPAAFGFIGHATPKPVPATGSSAVQRGAAAKYGKIPLSFEPNQGQSDRSVQFLSRGSGYSLFLTPGEVVLSLERQNSAAAGLADGHKPAEPVQDTLRMKLVDANVNAVVSGVDPQPGVVSYLIGNDPKKWHPGIHTFGKVEYAQIYPGVDLVFYGNQRQLEYDFVVAPGADASKIAWQIDGASATVDAPGDLQLHVANGPASFKSPVVYQMDGEKRVAVESAFDVAGNQVRFKLGSYDHSKPLIIDPVLSYASYLAGSSTDNIGMNTGFGVSGINNITQGAAVDSKGSLYVTGYTYSPDFPTTSGAFQATAPSRTSSRYPWAFVTKVSPDGSSLAYSTYLGGSVWDYSAAIAVDSNFNAYVTGYTASPDFPITPGAYLSYCGQNWNVTQSGIVEISGCPGLQSAFVTELNPTGTGLVYSTFLDGYGNSEGVAIAVDSAGRAYVIGNETDGCGSDQPAFACFPTTSGAIISGAQAGNPSQFPIYISVFDPTGSTLLYSTLFGDLNGIDRDPAGSGPTYATAITVDSQNNFYVTANVDGLAVPTTAGVIQPEPNGINTTYNVSDSVRGFIAKFTPVTSAGGPKLAYGTYLGGGQNLADSTSGIAVDADGNAYVTGYTQSYDFPVTAGAYQTTCGLGGGNNCASAYVVKLNPTASEIVWGTFIGDLNSSAFPGYQGPINQVGPVQLDGNGNVYITGQSSLGLPLVNPVEPVTGGNAEAFVAEFDPTGSQLLYSSLIGTDGSADSEQYPAGMAVDAAGDIYLAGNTFIGLITTPGSFEPNDPSTSYYHGFVAKISPTGTSSTSLTVLPSPATIGQLVTLTATVNGPGISSTPTGTVTFYNGATELGTGTLSGGIATFATASYATSSLAVGIYSLTASYSGDASFASSVSAAQSFTVNDPAPTTTSISPTSATAPTPAFTLTVNGTNFVPSSQVLWNGSSLVITSHSPTQLKATVPATGCVVGGMDTVTVFNPAPYGGASNSQIFTCNNPVPVATSISPTIAALGGPTFTLTVNGSKFVQTSTVNWNGSPLTTTYISATELQATVASTAIATAGSAQVTVTSPMPGGGTTSPALTIPIQLKAAALTSPVPSGPLPGASVTFTWSVAYGATNYKLFIGSTGKGSFNLYYNGNTAATSATVGGLPTNGETIYVRLYTNFNGTLLYNDYTYTAVPQAQATMTSPAPGSTLPGTGVTFTWTAAAGATDYELFLGSTGPGSLNLYYLGNTLATSATIGGLPANGETIHARLFTKFNGVLEYNDYIYAAVAQAPAKLTSPVQGTTLPGTCVTFTWSAITGATDYEFFIGSTGPGSYNLFYAGNTLATSLKACGLPTNGETIYARLFTKFNGTLEYSDYTFKAVSQAPAALTSPTNGSTLTGASATFTWTAATGVTDYELFVGSTGPGSYNLYYSGDKTVTSLTVNDLPTNGETIYVRLYTNFNGTLEYADYTFIAQ